MEKLIQIKNLTKCFGETKVLNSPLCQGHFELL